MTPQAIIKSQISHNQNQPDNDSIYDPNHPLYAEWCDHQANYNNQQKLDVPLKILSPITSICWMYMCESWRKHLDYDFQRPPHWNNDSPIFKFNHSWYVKYHNWFDWHDFALLGNDSLIGAHVIVNPHLRKRFPTYYFIKKIVYDIPARLAEATKRRTFVSIDNAQPWMPTCHVTYQTLKNKNNKWYLSRKQYVTSINKNSKWTVVDFSNMRDSVVQKMNNVEHAITLPTPDYQHPDVAENKPFIFVIFGSDAYHHTEFTGLTSLKTHGGYWWTANFNPDLQFTKMCTFITFQSTALASLKQILPKLYLHWQFLIQHGCIVWNGERLIKMFGMVSHQIGDMQDRDIYLRRRGAHRKSRSDGLIWHGYRNKASWPRNVNDLLNVGCVVPGSYLLKVWQLLNKQCVRRGFWASPPDNIGKSLTLTKSKHDVYNELPIDSTLKAPLEINHTTLLGLLTDAFEIEWVHLHHNLHFNEKQSKTFIYSYLYKFWHKKNGLTIFLTNSNCNILTFNQMQHSWQKMLEIMISLPFVFNWIGNISLLTSLIRMTGALFSCRTENRRLYLQNIVKRILSCGMSSNMSVLSIFKCCVNKCMFAECFVTVDARWGTALNTPKMRHFKQIFAYMRLYNVIRFIDGKFVELLHDIGKTLQSHHSNHHTTHKEQLSAQSFHMLTMFYAINGGHWGTDMTCRLGHGCLNLRNPTNLTQINPVLKSFKIPKQCPTQHKIQITGLYNKDIIPSPTQAILINRRLKEFMQHINHGLDSLNHSISWSNLLATPNVSISQIKHFRFHQHHCSFTVNFAQNHECIMSNYNNQVCEFRQAFLIEYPGNNDIIMAFGSVSPIYRSNQSTLWIDNDFNSMDFIDSNNKSNHWFYLTNMKEPVILIHECVSFESIKNTLPHQWRQVSNISFHKDFAYNINKVKQDIEHIQSHSRHNRAMHCPCGPVFKCKKHSRRMCRHCQNQNETYSRHRWNVQWVCNKEYSTQYRILDMANGLNMTLMKTVQLAGADI